jgi:glycosyltransferase involved in cell wall biosynthesis
MNQKTSQNTAHTTTVGVVVIGRNEGERLKRCLSSLVNSVDLMVYVDSGSTDGSVAFAQSLGVNVVDLDLSKPFTMPRGRNEGFDRLIELKPNVDYVQFVDGDCEVQAGWIEIARKTLDEKQNLVAVSGRRRERFPEASLYNHLCDIEWNGPTGIVANCGGDVMMRAQAFKEAGGFNAAMIAGEEGELTFRLREKGWQVCRLDVPMTLHDAAMTRFGQWWKRTLRAGHAYAEGMSLHGKSPERYNVRPVISCLIWGMCMPVFALVCLVASWFWLPAILGTVGVAGLTIVTWLRIMRRRWIKTRKIGESMLFSTFCLLAKLPQAMGVAWFYRNHLRGTRSGLIEYKTATTS